jgi:hypothetical protein
MLRPALAFLLVVVASAAPPATAQTSAQTTPPAIRTFDLATLERLGEAIFRHDVAAARASDAVLGQKLDPAKEKLVGWLVNDAGDAWRVRFLRDRGSGPEAAYDVDVPARGEPRVITPGDRALSSEDLARFRAQRTAAAGVRRVCRPRYNTVVLKDPDEDGWLVWLLAPSPTSGVVPMGGHYRATVSADGRKLERLDALSNSCLVIDPRQGLPKGAQPVGLMGSHVVSNTPVETHVFLHHLYRMPVYLMTGEQMWKIEKGRIAKLRR